MARAAVVFLNFKVLYKSQSCGDVS